MSTTTVAEIAEHYLSTGRVRKGDVPFLLSEIERRIPWPPDAATVERVARAGYKSVNYRHSHTWDDDAEPTRDRWRTVSRAVLDALGGDR